jgi:hypothetical protein
MAKLMEMENIHERWDAPEVMEKLNELVDQ